MDRRKWVTLLIGWLVGSFFGFGQIMGLVGGMRTKTATPAPAA